ncbi:hypothetical protein HJG60_010135 [Phyllostomus discolor]|uniref:Uncharacterized protein n=1 Tax=Phyllostomus discolor TaxID=89673 RepID=A0A834AW92_9CHIR|nr:hypothetical protein HJG60_010135 [Phyllostomus discolor]
MNNNPFGRPHQVYSLELFSIKIEQSVFQLCLLLNTLGEIIAFPKVISFPAFHMSPPAQRVGEGPVGRVNKTVIFCKKCLSLTQGENGATLSFGGEGGPCSERPISVLKHWSGKPLEEMGLAASEGFQHGEVRNLWTGSG